MSLTESIYKYQKFRNLRNEMKCQSPINISYCELKYSDYMQNMQNT